ncbi:MAG: metallophosphoesterase [Gammaproteobacteria bacterium]
MFDVNENEALYQRLEERVGRVHLKQRLGIEIDHEGRRVFGQGRNFFHIENWVESHALIKTVLQMLLLHKLGQKNARKICVKSNDFQFQHLPSVFDGYTLLHITDLHLDMARDMPDVLIDTIKDLEYDICVLTGDFRANTYGPYQAALDGLRTVRPHIKGDIFAVLGNHDTIKMVPEIEDMGIRMLLNEYVRIEQGGEAIYLSGIDDPHYYRADNFEKASEDIPQDAVSILLAHSPEVYKHAAHADFNVMLSGHTHGGQLCLPGGIPVMVNARCPRRYCIGSWKYHQIQGYTSVGSGSCVVDVRLNCPPEVTLHRLRKI